MTTDLADYLSEQGWKVTVLTGFPMAARWEVYEGYRGRIFQREKRGKVDILRVWVYVPKRPKNGLMKTWKRIAFDSTLLTSGFPIALGLPRQDFIIAVCPPLQTGLASLWLKKLWRCPILYWLQDIVPDAALSTRMMRPGKALRIGRYLEQTVYTGVDKIGIISHGFQRNLEAKGIPPNKMAFLPNWADNDRFDSALDGKRTRAQLGVVNDRFVLVHAGSVSAKQYMENVIEAMKLLEPHTDIELWLVGSGNRMDAIHELTNQMQLRSVRFLPIITGADYVDMLRAANALIINQARAIKDILIPSKLLTYLPSERPVLGAVNAESEAARFIVESGAGIVVEPESPQLLAEAILRLKSSPELGRQMGQAGSEFIRKNYDRTVLLERFHTTMREMI